jgi:hypothetical protein
MIRFKMGTDTLNILAISAAIDKIREPVPGFETFRSGVTTATPD